MTIVQDPANAAYAEMPANALSYAMPRYVLPLAEIPELLVKLVRQPPGEQLPVSPNLRFEVDVARGRQSSMKDLDTVARRSVFTCPDCSGALWEIEDSDTPRFRCHIGHAFSAENMQFALDENVVRAFGTAIRLLEERIALAERLRETSNQRGHLRVAEHWGSRLREFEQEADAMRSAIRVLEKYEQQKAS